MRHHSMRTTIQQDNRPKKPSFNKIEHISSNSEGYEQKELNFKKVKVKLFLCLTN
jgi:hypothetical protein